MKKRMKKGMKKEEKKKRRKRKEEKKKRRKKLREGRKCLPASIERADSLQPALAGDALAKLVDESIQA